MKSKLTIKTLSVLSFFLVLFMWQTGFAQCTNCTADGPSYSCETSGSCRNDSDCPVGKDCLKVSYSNPKFDPGSRTEVDNWTYVQTNSIEGRDYMLFNVVKGQIYRWTTYGIEDNILGIDNPCLNDGECAAGLTCSSQRQVCSNNINIKCLENKDCGSGNTCNKVKTCDLAFDTELTLLRGNCGPTGEVLAYNRNGLFRNQSMIEWKSDFDGNVYLLVDNYKCQTSCDQNGLNCMKTSVGWHKKESSQCTSCSYPYPTTYPAQPPAAAFSSPVMAPDWTTTANNDFKAGEFQTFSIDKGFVYRWVTCGDTSYDTQLTLFRGESEGLHCSGTHAFCTKDDECPSGELCTQSCGEFLSYSDDSDDSPCAPGSKQTVLKWLADFTGKVTVLNNQFNCADCYKSPNPVSPWGHCLLTTMKWQRYDCNSSCIAAKNTVPGAYDFEDSVKTVSNVNHGDYIRFNFKKGSKYSIKSVEEDSSTKFTGLLALRKNTGSPCSGEVLAQSEKVIGSHEQEIIYVAKEDFVAELLVTGPECATSSKKATIEYNAIINPETRFFTDPSFEGHTWTGVTIDDINGLYILDYTGVTGDYAESYDQALAFCESYVYTIPASSDTVDEWTLPDIGQLYSIIDFNLYDSATPVDISSYTYDTSGEGGTCTYITQDTDCGYPEYICGDKQRCVRNNWYWSSTTVVSSANFSWGVNLQDGRSYRIRKADFGGIPATHHKVLCIKGGVSSKGQFDPVRPARERKFSGWSCDNKNGSTKHDIYFVIRNRNGDNILKMTDYLIKGGVRIPGTTSLYGFKYGETDKFPADTTKLPADIAIMIANINASCDGTALTVEHAFELDINDTGVTLVNKIRSALSGQPSPYYVTAYAGYKKGHWDLNNTLLPINEPFKLVDVCGDSLVTVGEMCDDGNNVTETCAYNTSCMVCSNTCQWIAGYSPQCHDTFLDVPDENCDCGPGYWTLTGTVCTSSIPVKRCPGYGDGTGSCTVCNEVCQAEILTIPYCGDGYKDPVEACDDGDLSNNNACKTDCAFGYCGDGYIFNSGAGANETCDDGVKNGYYETACDPGPCCNTTCNGPGPKCGDSILQRADCTGYMGCITVSAAAEVCDAGAANGGWKTFAQHNLDPGCNSTCLDVAPFCGDGTLQSLYEICDDGLSNQDGVYGKCRTDCSAKPRCGDGKIDGPGGDGLVTGPEVCDAGTNNGNYGFCNTTCTGIAHCGDAIIQNTHEQCDLGTGNFSEYAIQKDFSCKDNCTIGRWCGDVVMDDGRNLYLNTAAYYQFSEKTGTSTADSSGGGKTGTIVNAVRAYGKYGRGVFFDRSHHNADTDRVVAAAVVANTNLTLEAWIYPIQYALTGGYSTIVLGSGAYYLSLHSDGSLQTYWYGKSNPGYQTTGTGLIPLNTWTHVAAVWNATDVNLYVNGVLRATVPTTGTGNASGSTVIGAENVDRQFYGIIDEVALYTRALDADELMLHVMGKSGNEFCDAGDVDHGNGNLPTGTAVITYETECSTQCQWFHYCGDGAVDGPGGTGITTGPEVCDDGTPGNAGAYNKCNPGCTTFGPRCGDGVKNGPEQCDKAPSNTDTSGEAWDAILANDATATCRTTCLWAICGDGIIDIGEECDDGVNNSDTAANACRTNCVPSKCGDLTLDAGEECDDGDVSVNGVVANYNFEDGSGTTAADSTGNAFDGTVSGAIFYSLGKYGKALYFDGVDDFVTIPNSLAYTGAFSAFAWFKSAGTPAGGYHIVMGGQELEISITTAGVLRTGVYTTARFVSDAGSGLTDGNWHHVGFTFDGATKTAYIDGVAVGTMAVTGALTSSFANRTLGRLGSSTGYYLRGMLDDVRVYNRSLTSGEIVLIKDLNNDTCNNCMDARCGDGYVKTQDSTGASVDWVPNESCDDSNTNNNDYCRSDCQSINGACGDGVIQTGYPAAESCDNATTGSGIGAYCTGPCAGSGASIVCTVGCTVNHGACGDGNVDYVASEVCDDGNALNGDYCSYPTCVVTGYCGDGTKQINEACDSADPSFGAGQGVGGYCINSCQTILGSCGDAKIQGPGYTTATYGGTLPAAPGWTVQGPENCDINDPRTVSLTNTTGCSTTCGRVGTCGDGIRQARFEGCDGTVSTVSERMILKMDESAGGTAYDSSGYDNRGTVNFWRENLVTYSEDFINSAWSSYCGNKTNFSIVMAPDLSTTAVKIVMPSTLSCGASGGWGVLQTVSPTLVLGGTYTVSVWLKGVSGGELIGIGLNDGHMSTVTLTNEWKQYTATFTGITNVTRGLQFKGNVAGQTFYAWGAQLQKRSKMSAYTKTTSTVYTGGIEVFSTGENYGMWTEGKIGNAIRFDGSKDNVFIPHHASLNSSSVTISMWLYLEEDLNCDGNNNWRSILHKGSVSGTTTGYDIVLEEGRTIVWDTGNGLSDRWWPSGLTIPLKTWTHIILVYDSTGSKKAYLNGALIGTKAISALPMQSNINHLFISNESTDCPNGAGGFPGMIDDLRIFPSALTADEVWGAIYDIAPVCHADCMSNPVGTLDVANRDYISGWACDPDWPMNHANIRLEFYDRYNTSVDTRSIQTALTSEQSIQNLCGGGSGHRWSFDPILVNWVTYSQPFSVKAYAVTPDGSPETDTLLGTKDFTMGPICMDGVVEGDEECDDGNTTNTDTCRNDCKVPKCGDSLVSTGAGEVCELGATTTCVAAGVPGVGVSGTATCATDCKSWVTTPNKCTKTWNCANPPSLHGNDEFAWNNVNSYNQTWNGSAWSPADSSTVYNTTADSGSCRYKCNTNFVYDGGSNSCIGQTKTHNCTVLTSGFVPDFATATDWNTVSSYSSTYKWNTVIANAWAWDPPLDTVTDRDNNPSTTACRYKCTANYHEEGAGGCVSDDATWVCSAHGTLPANAVWNTVASYPQHWSTISLAYLPIGTSVAYSEIPSSTECRFKCNPGYKWNGTSCFAQSCGDGVLMDRGYTFPDEKVRLYMSEGAGTTAYDSSGNNNHGAISGATWTSGRFESGLSFDGVDDYVSLSYTKPANTFTMMAWVKTSVTHEIDPQDNTSVGGTSGQKYLFGANNETANAGAGVSVGTNGVSVYEHGNSYMPALAVYNGTLGTGWNHVAVVYNSRTPSIYINGVHVQTGVISARTTVYAPVRIGSGDYGAFNGQVDHVRIVAKAMSAAEIVQAMGEYCDEGAANGTYNHCWSDCTRWGSYCGDHTVNNPPETCDAGAGNIAAGYNAAQTCNTGCSWNSYCGDSKINRTNCSGYNSSNCLVTSGINEGCDSSLTGDALCDSVYGARTYNSTTVTCNSCTLSAACTYCGDGIVNGTEKCDDGANNGLTGQCNASCTGPIRLYVRSAGSDTDGKSWTTAFKTLQRALDEAKVLQTTSTTLVDIWVAAGTYYPTFAAGEYAVYLYGTVADSWSYTATYLNVKVGSTVVLTKTVPNGSTQAGPFTFTVPTGQAVTIYYSGGTSYSEERRFEVFRNSGTSVSYSNGGAYFRTQFISGSDNWNRYRHFELRNNVSIYGGFNGTETVFSARNITSNIVNLDGYQNSVYAYHVIAQEGAWQTHTNSHINSSAKIDGVTIKNGQANYATTTGLWWSYSRGGAVFTYLPPAGRSCPTLTNVTVSSCTSTSNEQDVDGVNDHKYCYSGTY